MLAHIFFRPDIVRDLYANEGVLLQVVKSPVQEFHEVRFGAFAFLKLIVRLFDLPIGETYDDFAIQRITSPFLMISSTPLGFQIHTSLPSFLSMMILFELSR